MPQVPPTATSGNDLEDLDAFIDRDGPGLSTLGAPPRWNGDPLDIDETMDRLPP
jgi:hypothetical protein